MRPCYVVWDKGEVVQCACKDGWRPWPVGNAVIIFRNAGHLKAFINAQSAKGRKVRAVLVGHGPYLAQQPQQEEEADEPEEYYRQKAKAFQAVQPAAIKAPF